MWGYMVCFLRISRCFLIALIGLIIIAGCSHESEVIDTSDSVECPVDYQSTFQTNLLNETLNNSLVTDVNIFMAICLMPKNIWSIMLPTNENSAINGPEFTSLNRG